MVDFVLRPFLVLRARGSGATAKPPIDYAKYLLALFLFELL